MILKLMMTIIARDQDRQYLWRTFHTSLPSHTPNFQGCLNREISIQCHLVYDQWWNSRKGHWYIQTWSTPNTCTALHSNCHSLPRQRSTNRSQCQRRPPWVAPLDHPYKPSPCNLNLDNCTMCSWKGHHLIILNETTPVCFLSASLNQIGFGSYDLLVMAMAVVIMVLILVGDLWL